MRKTLLITATLLSMSSHASFLDFLNSNPSIANVLSNASNTQFGSGNSVDLVEESTEQQCINAVHDSIQAQKDTPNEIGLLYAATLTNKAYSSLLGGDYSQEIKTRDFFGKQFRRGLSDRSRIKINSFSDKYVPHAVSGCSQFTNITSVTKSKIRNKTCRVINHQLSGERYKVIFCEGDDTVYTDFLDTPSEVIKTYNEIK